MNILSSVVDYFVVCESAETHSGKPKPYYLANNKELFSEWASRIIYVQVDRLSNGARNSWERERYHRSHIAHALETMADPDDMVIVGDCDEIANPVVVQKLKNPEVTAAQLELDFYYYNMNCKVSQGWAIGAYRWGVEKDPNLIRNCGSLAKDVVHFNNAGWHFSYFGGPSMIAYKMDSFMHHDDPGIREASRDKAQIAQIVAKGKDLFGRDLTIDIVPLSDRLPRYIMENILDYQDWTAK